MKIERFEDIVIWQEAKKFTIQIYYLFLDSRDFGFKDQMQRVSVSVMKNNAKGLCEEVRSMPILSKTLIRV